MALFKILKGSSVSLSSQPLVDGYAYFTPDDGRFYIDAALTTAPEYYVSDAVVSGTHIYRIEIESATWSELLDNAALTGVPTAPTAAAGTNTTQVATTAFVNNALSNGNFSFASGSTITGNGSTTSFVVNHAFDTRDVIVQVYDLATYDTVECDVVRTSTSAVTVSFATAPASGKTYRVLISSMTINLVPDVNNTPY